MVFRSRRKNFILKLLVWPSVLFAMASIVSKFIAMIIRVFGNVTVVIHTIFLNKENTATSYLNYEYLSAQVERAPQI